MSKKVGVTKTSLTKKAAALLLAALAINLVICTFFWILWFITNKNFDFIYCFKAVGFVEFFAGFLVFASIGLYYIIDLLMKWGGFNF